MPTMQHGRHGKITEIRDHNDGEHASITVTHGRRKRAKGPDGQTTGALVGWHQQSSTVHVPKGDAKNYQLGQKVHVGLAAKDDADDDEYEDDAAESGLTPSSSGKQGAVKTGAAPTPGQAKKSGRIARAMHRPAPSGAGKDNKGQTKGGYR